MIIGNNIQSEDQHIIKDQAKSHNVKKSHLEDKPPSRPLPSPAAPSEPQGLVARPSRGPWPWPSRTWPSLWPPPSTNPQSLGIPIKSQPHPSPPHHSEKKTRSYNDNRWTILPVLWTVAWQKTAWRSAPKVKEILSLSLFSFSLNATSEADLCKNCSLSLFQGQHSVLCHPLQVSDSKN